MFLKIISLLFFVGLSTTANAAEESHSLGFGFGSTYGAGLTYERALPNGWGVQVTGLPIWSEGEGGLIAGGVNIRRNFHSNGTVGVYGSFGVAGMYAKSIEENCLWEDANDDGEWNVEEENCETTEEISNNYAVGPGVGMEVTLLRNLIFKFELPLAIRNGSEGFGISPIPNAALVYRWDAN